MQDPLIPARIRQAKEKQNNDSKADERGEFFLLSIFYLFFDRKFGKLCFFFLGIFV
jgi:hypothetical protein